MMKESAVITGANRGIGRAVAVELARRGLRIALLARNPESLLDVSEQILAAGGETLLVRCDVTQESQVQHASKEIRTHLGAPLVVVNNAGIVLRAPVHEQSLADWQAVIDTNLTGPFLVTRAFLPSMLARRRGRFIQISSISATLGSKNAAAYAASKWGLIGFTKSLAEELRGTGLMTMSILPGSVDTDMLRGGDFPPQMTAEEVAKAVAFAAFDAPLAMNASSMEIFGP